MWASFKKLVKKVASKDRYFFTFIIIALFLSIPITVFAVLQSRDIRSLATDQDCFDISGDFKVTQTDADIILNHSVSGGGYVSAYDVNHDGKVNSVDALIVLQHNGEVCVPTISLSADPGSINQGGSSRLKWTVRYATSRTISPTVGTVSSSSSVNVSPNYSTTYTLRASNLWATSVKTVRVTVRSVSDPPVNPPEDSVQPPSNDGSSSPGSPGSSSPGSPGSSSSPPSRSGGGSVSVESVLNELKLKITAPYLLGERTFPLVIGGRKEEVKISGGARKYSINVVKHEFVLNRKLTILVGGSGTLTKRFDITPKKKTETVNVGGLFFGDVTGDNKISKEDTVVLFDSIAGQTSNGDINVDGVANSLDWAILMANFGKAGKL